MYPYDIVSFDHNLSFLAYHLTLWTLNRMSEWQWNQVPAALKTALASSLLRNYDFVATQRNAKFSLVYGAWRHNFSRPAVPAWSNAIADFTGPVLSTWATAVGTRACLTASFRGSHQTNTPLNLQIQGCEQPGGAAHVAFGPERLAH